MNRTIHSMLFATVLFAIIQNANAMIIASVSCDATGCDITPDGGPVALADATDFSLDVDWSPEHIELIEPVGDRGEWSMRLFFSTTGGEANNEGEMGEVILNEMGGIGIGDLNIQVDDLNPPTGDISVRYDIFGPDTLSNFFAHGFTLTQSSLNPIQPITGLEWTGARISVLQGDIAYGIWEVPEPSILTLIALSAAGFGFRRKVA